MSKDFYFEGGQFEEKIATIFIDNGYPTELFPVDKFNKDFEIDNASYNRVFGDGKTIVGNNFIFNWDAKLHGFISLSSACGFRGKYYIVSEKSVGGSKEEFDLKRVWVVPSSAVRLTFDKILNDIGRKGLDIGPASGEEGLYLNLNGDMEGPISRLYKWATKMNFKQFIENKCIFNQNINRREAIEELERLEKSKGDLASI